MSSDTNGTRGPERAKSSMQSLRERSEAVARSRAPSIPDNLESMTPEAMRKILHELRVHQIELETQNEELRQAYAELDLTRAHYFELYDLAPVGYCTLNDAGVIIEANIQLSALLDETRLSLMNQPFSQHILKEDQDIFYLLKKQLANTNEPQSCDLRMSKAGGTTIWVHLLSTLTQSPEGASLYQLTLTDITERKRLEKEILEINRTLEQKISERTEKLRQENAERKLAEERFRTAVNTAPIVVFNQDSDLRYTWISNWSQEIIGKRDSEAFEHADDAAVTEGIKQRVLASGQGERHEVHLYHQGNDLYFDLMVEPMRDASGRVNGIIGSAWNITQQKQAHRDQETYQHNLRSLANQLLVVEESERRRLAVDLHDGPGQILAAANMKLSILDRPISPEKSARTLKEVADLIMQAQHTIGTLTFELSPPVLHELGFVSAAQWLAADIERRFGLKVIVKEDGRVNRLHEHIATVLFRSLRELLVNVAKHAKASHAQVIIGLDHERVSLTVQDDGCGFDKPGGPDIVLSRSGRGGFGLFSVRERLLQLGGSMNIQTGKGKGTKVTLLLPLVSFQFRSS